jgi:hypothetical protein
MWVNADGADVSACFIDKKALEKKQSPADLVWVEGRCPVARKAGQARQEAR